MIALALLLLVCRAAAETILVPITGTKEVFTIDCDDVLTVSVKWSSDSKVQLWALESCTSDKWYPTMSFPSAVVFSGSLTGRVQHVCYAFSTSNLLLPAEVTYTYSHTCEATGSTTLAVWVWVVIVCSGGMCVCGAIWCCRKACGSWSRPAPTQYQRQVDVVALAPLNTPVVVTQP
jgi:hypothetical protein